MNTIMKLHVHKRLRISLVVKELPVSHERTLLQVTVYERIFFSLWHYSPYLSLVLLCIEVSSSHTIRHTVGLLWTCGQPIAERPLPTQGNTTYIHKRHIHALSGI
jgi:hypothetical protein